jgi:hypothetical protein
MKNTFSSICQNIFVVHGERHDRAENGSIFEEKEERTEQDEKNSHTSNTPKD